MIDTRGDTSDHSFETKGAFLAPSQPEQDVAWLDQKEKEVRASATELFPNGYILSKDTGTASVAQRGSALIDLANSKTSSYSHRNSVELYRAEVPVGKEIEDMRREDIQRAA